MINEKTQRALRILIGTGITYLVLKIFLMIIPFIAPFLSTI